MNQTAIGCYIARKRKGAESDTGAAGAAARRVQQDDLKMGERKVYAGYSIIQKLCEALPVTLPELMDGEDAAENSVHVYDNEQILGIASGAMSKTTGGTDVQDFISGVLMGLSVAEILAGIWVAGKTFLKQ